jgi:hypothetical protein
MKKIIALALAIVSLAACGPANNAEDMPADAGTRTPRAMLDGSGMTY